MKYAMRLKNLLSVLHVMTWVKVLYKDGGMITAGYPARLYEDLPEEVLNLQVVRTISMAMNQMNIIVVRRK